MVVQAEQARCATTTLGEQTLEGSETEEAPWSVICLPPTQWDSWDSSRLGKQDALYIPLDIYQGVPARSRLKSLI